MIFPRVVVCILGLALAASAVAQDSGAAKNLLKNPGFETGFKADSLWTGVTKEGYLAGEKRSAPVLTAGGNIGNMAMPVSVAVADMNADGLNDIVTADPTGFIRIYFNKGTKEEPKFTIGEMAGVFLSWSPEMAAAIHAAYRSGALRVPRIALGEVNGRQALYMGNYRGDLLRVQNDGSPMVPDFRQPQDISRATISTMKDPKRRWGNVFAPAVYDWNGDGKDDILMGEGSYSANNIHLLLNQGSSLTPRFDETNRSFLAFGDGREQLSPTVVDYNGDGKPDILVADRSGQIGLFLNPGTPWKPGVEIPFQGYLKSGAGSPEEVTKGSGTTMNFGGICTVAAGDFTGDGLFDLIVGKSNGRIAMIRNVGTQGSPKWQAPVEIKAEAPGPAVKLPSTWEIDTGASRGNFYGMISTVTEEDVPGLQPPGGTSSLRAWYATPVNEIMKNPSITYPGLPKYNPAGEGGWISDYTGYSPSNVFVIRQRIQNTTKANRPFQADTTYTLSFKVKGSGATGALAVIWCRGERKREDATVKAVNDRGGVVIQQDFLENRAVPVRFTPGSKWTEVKKDVKVTFKTPELNAKDTVRYADVLFYLPLSNGSGDVFIDDVELIAK